MFFLVGNVSKKMSGDADISDIREYMARRVRGLKTAAPSARDRSPAPHAEPASVSMSNDEGDGGDDDDAASVVHKPTNKSKDPAPSVGSSKKWIAIGVGVLVLALVGWAAYAYLSKRRASHAALATDVFPPAQSAFFDGGGVYGAGAPGSFEDRRAPIDDVPAESVLNEVLGSDDGAAFPPVADPQEDDACFTTLDKCFSSVAS